MSDKVSSADNQQGSRLIGDPSETTRRAPYSEEEVKAYLLGALHDATFSSNRRFRYSQKGTEWLKVLKALLKKIGYSSWIYKEGKERKVYVFDAEGGIPKNDKQFYIQLVQSEKQKLRKIRVILEELEIKTGKIHNPSKKVDPKYWRMYILAESHKHFARIINSWYPRKIKIFRKRMMI